MLKKLEIKNYAIIEYLSIDFDSGFNVMTGETGAGKSIIMGALGLTLGDRADTKVLRNASVSGYAEAVFSCPSHIQDQVEELIGERVDEIYIRRTILPSGSSRSFLNDQPITLKKLKSLGLQLVNRHDQHETLQLKEEDFQLHTVDALADNEEQRRVYQEYFTHCQEVQNEIKALKKKRDTLRNQADYLRFQVKEIDDSGLAEENVEDLEAEWSVMEHAEVIKEKVYSAIQQIQHEDVGLMDGLSSLQSSLQPLASYAPVFQELVSRVESLSIEMADIEQELENQLANTELDEARYVVVKERIDAAHRLMKKHSCDSLQALMEERDKLAAQLEQSDSVDDTIIALENELEKSVEARDKAAKKLTESRLAVFPSLQEGIEGMLRKVGMEHAVFKLEHQTCAPSFEGTDEITFLFSANPGFPPRDIAEVASGGELSRLMLSVKATLAGRNILPTLIFDEIDSGISGETAAQVGRVIKRMAASHQVIAITHLPQMAASGHKQFAISKSIENGITLTHVKPLSTQERVEWIAGMLSGDTVTQAAREHAKTLLKANE